jgi:hypothetical protein
MMAPQIVVQRLKTLLFKQVLEHQILAATLGKVRAVFLAQSRNPCVAMLALYAPTLVAVTPVETFGHLSLLKN